MSIQPDELVFRRHFLIFLAYFSVLQIRYVILKVGEDANHFTGSIVKVSAKIATIEYQNDPPHNGNGVLGRVEEHFV